MIALQQHVKESFLPLPSSTKLAESNVKDTDFCGSTGQDEIMIRSISLSQMTSTLKKSEEFKSKKKINDEVRDYTHGKRYTTKVLTGAFSR